MKFNLLFKIQIEVLEILEFLYLGEEITYTFSRIGVYLKTLKIEVKRSKALELREVGAEVREESLLHVFNHRELPREGVLDILFLAELK